MDHERSSSIRQWHDSFMQYLANFVETMGLRPRRESFSFVTNRDCCPVYRRTDLMLDWTSGLL